MAEALLDALQAAGTGYDADVLEGLVGTIAVDPASAQGILDNFFAGNAKAASAVRAFLTRGGGGSGGGGGRGGQRQQQQPQQQQQQQQQRRPAAAAAAPPAAPPSSSSSQRAARAPYVPPPLPSFTSSLSRAPPPPQPPQLPPAPAPTPATTAPATTAPATSAATAVVDGRRVALEQAEAQLAIFKKGGRIRAPRPADGSGGADGNGDGGGKGGGQASLLDRFERRVANCLSCGKVFDGREATPEIVAFVNRGGTCDYCGARVALTYAEAREQSIAQEGRAGAAAAWAGGGGGGEDDGGDAQAAAARDLKDRLVTYDRESASRTTVLDDQSDFYEVSQLEGDAWASEGDRAAARARGELERAAEREAEERRRKFTVTLDLLGRRVLRAETSSSAADGGGVGIVVGGGGGGGAAAAAPPRIPELAAAPREQQQQQQQRLQQAPGAGGRAAGIVTAEALEAAYASVANLRIRPVDDVAGGDGAEGEGGARPRLRYVPSAAATAARDGRGRGGGGRGGGAGGRGAGANGGRGSGGEGGGGGGAARRHVVQDDSAFAELEGVLLYDQVATGG